MRRAPPVSVSDRRVARISFVLDGYGWPRCGECGVGGHRRRQVGTDAKRQRRSVAFEDRADRSETGAPVVEDLIGRESHSVQVPEHASEVSVMIRLECLDRTMRRVPVDLDERPTADDSIHSTDAGNLHLRSERDSEFAQSEAHGRFPAAFGSAVCEIQPRSTSRGQNAPEVVELSLSNEFEIQARVEDDHRFLTRARDEGNPQGLENVDAPRRRIRFDSSCRPSDFGGAGGTVLPGLPGWSRKDGRLFEQSTAHVVRTTKRPSILGHGQLQTGCVQYPCSIRLQGGHTRQPTPDPDRLITSRVPPRRSIPAVTDAHQMTRSHRSPQTPLGDTQLQ